MVFLYFATTLVYSIYAYLPFVTLGKSAHYVSGCLLSVMGSMLWVTISRSVDKSEIPLYGLYFDAIITLTFFFVPLIFSSAGLGLKQVIGVVVIFIGILLTKL